MSDLQISFSFIKNICIVFFLDNEIVATYYTFEKSGNSDWKVVSFSHTGNIDRYTTLRMGFGHLKFFHFVK